MSSTASSLLVLAAFLTVAGAVGALALDSKRLPLIFGVIAVVFVGLGVLHTGGFGRGTPIDFPAPASATGTVRDSQRCREAVRLLKESRAIGSLTEDRVVVNRIFWDQVPEQSRAPIIACLEITAGAEEGALRVVVRDFR